MKSPEAPFEVTMLEYHAAFYAIEDGWYMARVLDFPGVITQGRNREHVRRMARSALQDMAEWYLDDGQVLPRPNPRARDRKAEWVEPITLSPRARIGTAS